MGSEMCIRDSSYRVSAGDKIELKPATKKNALIEWNKEVLDRTPPAWMDLGEDGLAVTIAAEPIREQIDIPLREQLIVELYSK